MSGDAGDGTAGVEVDALKAAEGLNAAGGLGEALGLIAIEVCPDVALGGEGFQEEGGLGVTAAEAFGVDHLGVGARGAVLLAE